MPLTLIPIFADQLSVDLCALAHSDPSESVVLMMEVRGETETVPHHRKKLIFLFSAMRHFAEELRGRGWTVDYVALDAEGNTGTFTDEVKRAQSRHDIDHIRLCEPSEYRVLKVVKAWEDAFNLPVTLLPDDRFLANKTQFADWAEGRKQLRIEYFYRDMRRQTGLTHRR